MSKINCLSKIEYNKGAETALKNSKLHLDTAKLLKKNNIYPFAITHCILSIEEMIKASILKIKATDDSLEIKHFLKYFSSHKVKHRSIFYFIQATYEINSENKIFEKIYLQLNTLLAGVILATIGKMVFHNEKDIFKTGNDLVDSIEKTRLTSTYIELGQENTWNSPKEIYDLEECNMVLRLAKEIQLGFKLSFFDGKINSDDLKALIDKLN